MWKKILVFILIIVSLVGVGLFLFSRKNTTNIPEDIVITFNNNGNVSNYETTGFAEPESDLAWTNGKEAAIKIPVAEISKDYTFAMSVDMKPFVAKKIKKQTVDVIVNDENVAKWDVDKESVYTVYLPQTIIGEELNVKFKISNPKSPKELKISKDKRKLGIAIKNIKLSAVDAYNPEKFPEYKIGRQISFAYNGTSEEYIGTGWSGQEKHARWTEGNDAYLKLFIEDIKERNLQLLVSGRGMFAPEEPCQQITVYVNGTEVTTWNVSRDFDFYSVMLPESVLGTGALNIRFHIDKPFSPGADTRKLGIFVKEIKIREPMGAQTKIKVALWLKNKVLKNVKSSAEESANKK